MLAAPAPAARAFETGIVDAQAFYRGELAFARARAANASMIRVPVFWNFVAPARNAAARPAFDATDPADPGYALLRGVDELVKGAAAKGLEPMLGIVNAPRWARPGCPLIHCYPDPAEYAAFATALARRYSGRFRPTPGAPPLPRVRYWQVWNEPNLGLTFEPQRQGGRLVSPDLYRNLVNALAGAVKGVARSNLVVGGGLSPGEREDAVAPLDFTRRVFCMRGRARPRPKPGCDATTRIDIWATHPYTLGVPRSRSPNPDNVWIGDLPRLRRLVRAAERAGHLRSDLRRAKLWATEFSWDSNPPNPQGLRPGLLARWTAEAFYRMWRGGVSAVFWFLLRDEAARATGQERVHQSGLYLRGETLGADRPKRRLLRAFRFPFVALRDRRGIRVWGKAPQGRGARVRILLGEGRSARRLATVRAGAGGIFHRVIRTKRRRGTVRARVARGATSLPFILRPSDYLEEFVGED